MSTISLRLPGSLHKSVRDLAKEDNISINQFIATALLISDELNNLEFHNVFGRLFGNGK